jgi:hypothetical protein
MSLNFYTCNQDMAGIAFYIAKSSFRPTYISGRRSMKIIYILLFAAVFYTCKKTGEDVPVNPLEGLTKLKDGYALGASAKVEIWGEKNFFAGFNKLAVVLYDSLNPATKINDAHIHFMPVMTMKMGVMDMQQSTPVENPDEGAVDGAFPGAIAFVMASDATNIWQLGVEVHNHESGKEGEAQFDITVDNPDISVITVFPSLIKGDGTLALSLVKPTDPQVGMNEMEFAIYREVSMMEWQPEDSYTIEITPEMPAMGHGSTDNVNPVNKGNGHYMGKVNLSATGEWKVNVLIKEDGTAVSPNLFFLLSP